MLSVSLDLKHPQRLVYQRLCSQCGSTGRLWNLWQVGTWRKSLGHRGIPIGRPWVYGLIFLLFCFLTMRNRIWSVVPYVPHHCHPTPQLEVSNPWVHLIIGWIKNKPFPFTSCFFFLYNAIHFAIKSIDIEGFYFQGSFLYLRLASSAENVLEHLILLSLPSEC